MIKKSDRFFYYDTVYKEVIELEAIEDAKLDCVKGIAVDVKYRRRAADLLEAGFNPAWSSDKQLVFTFRLEEIMLKEEADLLLASIAV